MALCDMPAWKLAEMMKNKEVSAVEVVKSVLDRIKEREKDVHAYNEVFEEDAIKEAEAVDRDRAVGRELPFLAGIPVAIKDNMCIKGREITCSSKILKGFTAPYDATAVKRIKDNRMVIVGRTNMDEFAMGSSTENSAFGPTKNPRDFSRVPGGSSGGSAAAVAAGEAVMALGSDTGGSIRQPAAFCGVVGMKPTYGMVSRFGLIAFASSLDQIGPITRDVKDAALLLGVISGNDPYDSTSLPVDVPDYLSELDKELGSIKIGIIKEYLDGVDEDVKEAMDEVIKIAGDMGADVKEVSLPHTKYALATYYIIAPAEASSNLARYDGVQYGFSYKDAEDIRELYRKTRTAGFGKEVKRRIMMGTYALSSGYYDAFYLKAQKVRTLIKKDFDTVFDDVDLIMGPTSPTVAFRLGERVSDPISMYLSDIFTIPVNLSGVPAISLPFVRKGRLPVGVQLMGRTLGEIDILKFSYRLEKELKERGFYNV